jgi:hypothetical protein
MAVPACGLVQEPFGISGSRLLSYYSTLSFMTVWSLLEECVSQIDEPFRRSEIVAWFRRHHPEVSEATLALHIQAATVNAANRGQNSALGRRPALLRRVDHGLYVRFVSSEAPTDPATAVSDFRAQSAAAADIVLIGCVRTKLSTAAVAADLFASPLFAGRRRYAVGCGRPWYILSAKYGLLDPGDVIGPYDVYLADQSPGYQAAWGDFVVAQLEQAVGGLSGRVVEVHAGNAYVQPLRAPLAARRAELATPVAHLRQGEQLAWYNNHAPADPGAPHPQSRGDFAAIPAPDLANLLSDAGQAVTPREFLVRGPQGLECPGLYSWWVDDAGAADLSQGLGQPLHAGLLYAGQAGATRWPSGQRSRSTLWSRISGMHLGASAEFSTFRRTLAAILRPVIALVDEDDPRLSQWMDGHLTVITVAVADGDQLAGIESAVLDILDPPLNLRGRPAGPVRDRLAQLRGGRTIRGQTNTTPTESEPVTQRGALTDTERQFHQAMVGLYETAKRDLGYNATRFLQMISEQGGVATARQLLWSDQPSDGFTTLWSHHRLDLSVESHVLKPEYQDLFTDADRQQARGRLTAYGWTDKADLT